MPWLYRLGWVWATEKYIHEYFHIYRKSPNNIFRLPPRIRAICHNLLKTVEEYDAELSALQRPQGEEGDIFHDAIWSAFQLWSISCQRTRERNQIMFFSGLNSIMNVNLMKFFLDLVEHPSKRKKWIFIRKSKTGQQIFFMWI